MTKSHGTGDEDDENPSLQRTSGPNDAHAQGQAAVGATLEDDDSGSPLFTSSPGYESDRPSV